MLMLGPWHRAVADQREQRCLTQPGAQAGPSLGGELTVTSFSMANPSTQVPSLQQLGLSGPLPSPEDALKSLQGNNSLPPGWNTAAQQAALPRPPPLPSPDVAFAPPSFPPQQVPMMGRPDPNAALAGLLHGTIAPSLIPNPAQFLLRNFGIDITGLNHLRGNFAQPAQQPPPAAAQRSNYGPAPLTQFLHSEYEPPQQQHHIRSEHLSGPNHTMSAPQRAPKPQQPAEQKRKEHTTGHHQQPAPKRQTQAQAAAYAAAASVADEPASDWVPSATGRDPFHARVGSIPLVDLRAQPMSYLQDFMAQVIRDAGKVPLTSNVPSVPQTINWTSFVPPGHPRHHTPAHAPPQLHTQAPTAPAPAPVPTPAPAPPTAAAASPPASVAPSAPPESSSAPPEAAPASVPTPAVPSPPPAPAPPSPPSVSAEPRATFAPPAPSTPPSDVKTDAVPTQAHS